jgi:hypothetical protein
MFNNHYKFKYLVIVLTIIAGYLFLYINSSSLNGHAVCVFFKKITGIACPSCGSTRATVLLIHGHFIDSIYMNPLVLIINVIIVISLFWMLMNVFELKDTFLPFMKRTWPTYLKIFILTFVFMNWLWNIYKGL